MNKKSLTLSRALTYARLAAAGAIGGVAVVNTFALMMASTPSPTIETYAAAIGAAAFAGLTKILHVA